MIIIIIIIVAVAVVVVTTTMFMVLNESPNDQSLRVYPANLMNADWAPGVRQSSDEKILEVDLGCKSAENW